MIGHFNFFDVYAYLIPGFFLLSILLLPVLLVDPNLYSPDLSDALIAVVGAYVLGHVLYTLIGGAFRTGRKDEAGVQIYPSEDLLDPGRGSSERVEELERAIKCLAPWIDLAAARKAVETAKEAFQNVKEGAVDARKQELEECESRWLRLRREAFRLCRDKVLLSHAGAYAEQAQGMYTLLRGLFGASLLGASCYVGWILGSMWSDPPTYVIYAVRSAFFLSLAALSLVDWVHQFRSGSPRKGKEPKDVAVEDGGALKGREASSNGWYNGWRRAFWILALTLLLMGVATSWMMAQQIENVDRGLFLSGVLALVFIATRCHERVPRLASEFAESVYRNFILVASTSERDRSSGRT